VSLANRSTTCKALVEETIIREGSNLDASKFRAMATVLIIAGILGEVTLCQKQEDRLQDDIYFV
jgi:hypothetical protein